MRNMFLLAIAVLLITPVGCTRSINEACPDNELVTIPAGWFSMGEDDGRRSNEPERKVYLDGYAIQRTEVTNCQYLRYLEEIQLEPPDWNIRAARQYPDWPATGLLWQEARSYCEWMDLRLPTEAEWEKAARGAYCRNYPWGFQWDATKTNTLSSGIGHPVPVGSYPAGQSPYGLQDTIGNAAEWVSDVFDFAYYTYAPIYNPQGPDISMDHVIRGGSYATPDELAVVYFRDSSHSIHPNPRVGVRCAMSLDQ